MKEFLRIILVLGILNVIVGIAMFIIYFNIPQSFYFGLLLTAAGVSGLSILDNFKGGK